MAGDVSTHPQLVLDDNPIETLVQGVFEGGGAKGVLYVGALKATLEKKIWFSAVAGSSAGAITAAMIAAGMGPIDIEAAMHPGLDAMAPPKLWRGLWRVRKGNGFLDRERVRIWLRDLLRGRFQKGGPHDPKADRGPTFEQLYESKLGGSGIDLYVVAVDLTGRHVMVFNHALTPQCPVADAVTASATIPVAFEPLIFQTLEQRGEGRPPMLWRFVADGGLASNFPDFVFHDAGFRKYAGLPAWPDEEQIVGFLLDEDAEDPTGLLELYKQGSFLGSWSDLRIELERISKEVANTKEGSESEASTESPPSPVPANAPPTPRERPQRRSSWIGSFFLGVERLILLPIRLLGALSQGNRWPWNWPKPKNRHAGLWIESLRQWFTAAPLQTIGGLAVFAAMFWVGFVSVTRWLVPDFRLDELSDAESIGGFVVGLVVGVAWVVIAAWVWLLGIGAFLLMLVSYRTVGLIGHYLVRAFLQAPAAPPWAGWRPRETVIRLNVPKNITTLGLKPSTKLNDEIERARMSAFHQLERVVRLSPTSDKSRKPTAGSQ